MANNTSFKDRIKAAPSPSNVEKILAEASAANVPAQTMRKLHSVAKRQLDVIAARAEARKAKKAAKV